ncbi:MAG TPA: HAD family hydrolase [Gemmataceae bacterium]|nr:HAD family hydrolase [Gemmataceae bacterium]
MARVRGVILDVDGTLVVSNDAHARAWVEALAEHGVEVDYERVRRLIGMGGDKLLPKVSGIRADSPEGQAITRRRQTIFLERYLPHLRPTPGAPELLQFLRDRGFRLSVASSAKQDELKPLLEICGGERLIEDKTSSDDADRSKPDPDIVGAALKKLGLPKDEVLMLGDTPYDVEAARRAGLAILAVRCGGWGDTDLAGALAVYDDPADLLAHFGASPLGASASRRD